MSFMMESLVICLIGGVLGCLATLPLNGLSLSRFLHRYSERGDAYVDAIRAMIRANGLDRLDDARLIKGQDPEA